MPEPGLSPKIAASDASCFDAEERLEQQGESAEPESDDAPNAGSPRPVEIGGRDGPDPTRYGDWEYKGRCIDF